MSVMSSPRNRCRVGVDNPTDDDGFWQFRKFKGSRKNGAPTGGRLWRRTIRTREKMDVRAEIASFYDDQIAEMREWEAEELAWDDVFPEEMFSAPLRDEQPYIGDYEDDLLGGCNDDCPSCLAADEAEMEESIRVRRREEADKDYYDRLFLGDDF